MEQKLSDEAKNPAIQSSELRPTSELDAALSIQAERLIGDVEYGCGANFGQYRGAALAIARAYIQNAPPRWQPIETAPINESVLIYIPNAEHYGEGIYRAIWIESDWLVDGKKPRHWQTTGWHHGRDCTSDTQPTHWMPLPVTPNTHVASTAASAGTTE